MTNTHGRFHWNELMTHDPERAKRFYTSTIGWRFDAVPMADGGTYWVAKNGEERVAGLFEMRDSAFAGAPEHWVPYVAVDDVDARVTGAVAAGASVMRPPFDIPEVGRIAYLHEPGGATVVLITPSS